MRQRDEDDWPVLALALMLNLSVWTEGQDLFGAAWRRGLLTVLSFTFEADDACTF